MKWFGNSMALCPSLTTPHLMLMIPILSLLPKSPFEHMSILTLIKLTVTPKRSVKINKFSLQLKLKINLSAIAAILSLPCLYKKLIVLKFLRMAKWEDKD